MNPKTKEQTGFLLGTAICFAVAGLSVLLEHLIPGELLGASIIALFMATGINSFFHPNRMKDMELCICRRDVGKCCKYGKTQHN